MKTRIFMIMAALLLAFSCSNPIHNQGLQSGDLIFVGLPMDYSLDHSDESTMDNAIVAATGGEDLNMIHVAMVEVAKDSVWIIDATVKHGVDRHPLGTFLEDFRLHDGSYPQFIVKRMNDNSLASQWVDNAKKYLGRPYDTAFGTTDDALYCSELVEDSYLDADGKQIFHSAPMNFKADDGEFPLYWIQLFERIQAPIPQGEMGTNPMAMSKEDCLATVEGLDITDF